MASSLELGIHPLRVTLLKYPVTEDDTVRQVPVGEYLVNPMEPSLALQRVPPVQLDWHDTEKRSPVPTYSLTAHFPDIDCSDEGEYQCKATIQHYADYKQLVLPAESVTLCQDTE